MMIPGIKRSAAQAEKATEAWLPGLVAGLLSGVVVLLGALSQAALIFSGPLEGWLPLGMGAALFAAGVIAAVLALASSLKGMIGLPQAVPLAVLGMVLRVSVAAGRLSVRTRP